MGSKKTFVGTQVSRVIEDNKLPDSVKKGVLAALIQEGEVVDSVLEELISSVGIRAERMYDWAQKGNYVHGLPSGQFAVPGEDVVPAVQAVLTSLHGSPVEIEYARFGPANNLHLGWMHLVANQGYNGATNELATLSTTKGTPVYLHDMVVVVPKSQLEQLEPRTLEQWGQAARAGFTPERTLGTPETMALIQPSPVEASAAATQEQLRVEYVWVDATKAVKRDSLTILVPANSPNAEFFHVRYKVGGQVKFWMYRVGSKTHPTLDALFDAEPSTSGEFFPFLYFRYGKVSENSDKNSESYKDNKKLAKFLGMDFDQVADGVNANPDIKDVEQAMMMFAVPANTENEQERAYLFDFFNRLYRSQAANQQLKTPAQADILKQGMDIRDLLSPTIVIQDKRFKMALSNQGIFRLRRKGVIGTGKVGSHDSGYTSMPGGLQVVEKDTGTNLSVPMPARYHYYRRQITHDLYEEIRVAGLETRFHIFGEYSTTGDEEDQILLIPLDHSITEDYPITDREKLYSRSLHFVFNSVTTIKLKWYQTGLFKAILVIVAIIITVLTYGLDVGSTIYAALAVGAYTLAAQLIIQAIVVAILVRQAFKLFVKVVGAKWAFVAAIVMVIAAAYGVADSGSLASAPWAQDLLSVSTNLANAAAAQVQADMKDFLGEFSDFEKYVEEQTKVLESAQALLDTNHHMSPMMILGEKPDEFYNRTVHSGNIGVVSFDAVSEFVGTKLMLPRLSETLKMNTGEEDQ